MRMGASSPQPTELVEPLAPFIQLVLQIVEEAFFGVWMKPEIGVGFEYIRDVLPFKVFLELFNFLVGVVLHVFEN